MKEMGFHCPDVPVDETGSATPHGRKVIQRLMGNAQVLLCTLNSSGPYYIQDAVKGATFQTFLLDEGGQCTEAEFFIATTFPGVNRIIVMGDPKQLRPTVLEPACSQAGYGESWLSRVYKLYPSKIHLLDTQYRMDPVILRFPNQRFYKKRIKSGDNVVDRCPPVEQPFRFIDTQGRGREERDENHSFRNSYEIAVIRDILKNDSDIAAILKDNKSARIIIITPYKAQAKLLQEMARSLKFINLEVSTVDAFQGQEGEIVILSTVRTRNVGFVDDSQRLNVALTRAKRVLRVVGDRKFFIGLRPGSTLRALSAFATKSENFQVTKLRSIPTCPPDLSRPTRWRMTMTQKFRHVLGALPLCDKYVALNTLFALALPDLNALGNRLVEKEGWHTTFLKGYESVRLIWVARNHEGVGIVEAHFGGTKDDCLRFRQLNHVPPDGCCVPRADMSGIVAEDVPPPENGRMFVSWSLDSQLQSAILSNKVLDLPLSMIQLDPPQERIARSPPPLLIESRSGTGKTLVLLQHAAFYHRPFDPRPACFITVSPRLRNELEQKYEELTPIHGAGLPKTKFFSFRDFINGLLSHHAILDFEDKDKCTFQGYIMARRSHQKLLIEPHLLENEIGGVIMGSVVAAQQGGPLNRQQYQMDKRSNIPNRTEEGCALRNVVYDEYERYKEWKCSTGKYDIHDAVLRLQKETPQQLFSSAYLDEVQDLSHAAIFLICGLAGRDKHYWICGGDPAQMISPGCSFTFDGLKQTLLALEGGIEKKVKQVEHLLVNYRTTKDILTLGNQILATARNYFPGAIDFARPERARKDLGLKVAICSWKAAFGTKAKFGDNQAFIYSSNDPENLLMDAREWLDNHPFILSSLDSKGLEFDDVVVAFDHDRKTWQVECKMEASLGMLRELYVAITRAQQRVVVLVKDDTPAMIDFFGSLNCDLERTDSSRIFQEFNRDTSTEEWFKKAQKLFGNEQFSFAASCFTRAQRQDWSFLAKGHHLLAQDSGLKEEAGKEFRRAARIFYEGRCYKQVLNILLQLLEMTAGAWDSSDDKIFMMAVDACPQSIPRTQGVRYAILREDFSSVLVSDLKDRNVCQLLIEYRQEPWLKRLVAECSDDDRNGIAGVLPMVVFDYDLERSDFFGACKIALCTGDYLSANSATLSFLEQAKKTDKPESIVQMAGIWNDYGPTVKPSSLSQTSPSILLQRLFQAPSQLPSALKSSSTSVLGKQVVLLAVDKANLERTVLLDFSPEDFKPEVDALLISKYGSDLLSVFRWYATNGHAALASQFAKERLFEWSSDDLLRITINLWTRPRWLFEELKRRQLLDASLQLVVLSPFIGETSKKQFLQNYLIFKGGKQNNPGDLNEELGRMTSRCRKDVERVLKQLTKRSQLVEKAFLQIWLECDAKTAVECSREALEPHELASANIARILLLWHEVQRATNSKLPPISTETFEDKFSFLMCLFFGDEPTKPRRNFYLEVQDQFFSLLILFGPTAAAYCKIHDSKALGRQDEELLQRLEKFHADLRSNLRSRYAQPDQNDLESNSIEQRRSGDRNSAPKEEAGGANESKALSKKAARKQKKSQANNTATTNTTTKANKKKQNKKKNNKKKRGKK